MNGQLGSLFQKVSANADRWSLPRVVGIRLEREAQNRQALASDRAKQFLHHQAGNAVLLPGIEQDHALPIVGHIWQPEVAAEIHQIEDVFLKTTAPKSRTCVEKFWSNPAIGADRFRYLTHIRTGGLTQGCNGVNRANSLRQKSISGELGQLATPQIGAENLFFWHPLAVNLRQGINRLSIVTTDQHTIRIGKIANRRPLCQKFRIRQHRKSFGLRG